MPALRERDNDVILLANYCATMTSKRYSLEFDGFTDEAIKLIKNYSMIVETMEIPGKEVLPQLYMILYKKKLLDNFYH